MLLTATGLCKTFGLNAALRNAAFGVRENETAGLIGPNGSGKTTLLECLAGLIPADSGEIRFRGVPLPPSRSKEALFYLPDGIRPWADQRVGWLLRFFAALHGRSAAPFLTDLQLDEFTRARIGSLSKGEAKRVLLALALATPQPLLLLDEPFDGLDFRQVRDASALLRGVAAAGRTLFLSIHQLGDAARICHRLVLLSHGAVVGEGTLDELRAKTGLREGGLEEIFLALT